MVKKRSYRECLVIIAAALLLYPSAAAAQQNVPPPVQRAERDIEREVKRFGVGIQGGVALDPELLDVGAHMTFGPIFTPAVQFRPGVELGLGEVTTFLGINLDVLYALPGTSADTRWAPYVGAGPNFSYSRRDFDTESDDDDNRFDFSDSDGSAGFNFIAGARNQSGLFIELKATAWGVSNIRLLAGFNF